MPNGEDFSSYDDDEDELSDYMSDEDDFNYRLSTEQRKRTFRRGGLGGAVRPPPLITIVELFEQALLLQQQRNSQRSVKIYFDSNDEYVRQEQIPELAQSSARMLASDESLIMFGGEDQPYASERQRLHESIAFKYNYVSVYFGNEDVQNSGTTRITRNIFAGNNDRTENAILFLDNLNKIK